VNQSEFEQIKAHLGEDYSSLSFAVIDQRIRETTEYASVIFYIDIHSRNTGTIFYSSNLRGRSIPDIKGAHRYDVRLGRGSVARRRIHNGPLRCGHRHHPRRRSRCVMEGYAEVLCRATRADAGDEHRHRPWLEPSRAAPGAPDTRDRETASAQRT